jgi:hypothetical protein
MAEHLVDGRDRRQQERKRGGRKPNTAGFAEPDFIPATKAKLLNTTTPVRSYPDQQGFQLTRRVMAFEGFELS